MKDDWTIKTKIRGHIVYTVNGDDWFYADDNELYDGNDRACTQCNLLASHDEPDPCLGMLDGVDFACCSHGEEEYGYVLDSNKIRWSYIDWAKIHYTWRMHPKYSDYWISSHGEVKRVSRASPEKIIKQRLRADGYLDVRIKIEKNRWRSVKVHTLVLEAFIGERPDGMECRHLDGMANNNKLSNLEWATHSKNCLDKRSHGTMIRGSKSKSSKLSEEDVLNIYHLLDGGATMTSVAKEYKVDRATISRINSGQKWSYLFYRRSHGTIGTTTDQLEV